MNGDLSLCNICAIQFASIFTQLATSPCAIECASIITHQAKSNMSSKIPGGQLTLLKGLETSLHFSNLRQYRILV